MSSIDGIKQVILDVPELLQIVIGKLCRHLPTKIKIADHYIEQLCQSSNICVLCFQVKDYPHLFSKCGMDCLELCQLYCQGFYSFSYYVILIWTMRPESCCIYERDWLEPEFQGELTCQIQSLFKLWLFFQILFSNCLKWRIQIRWVKVLWQFKSCSVREQSQQMTDCRLDTSLRIIGKDLNFFREESCINKLSFINIISLQVPSKQKLLPHANRCEPTMKLLGLIAIVDVAQRVSCPMSKNCSQIDQLRLNCDQCCEKEEQQLHCSLQLIYNNQLTFIFMYLCISILIKSFHTSIVCRIFHVSLRVFGVIMHIFYSISSHFEDLLCTNVILVCFFLIFFSSVLLYQSFQSLNLQLKISMQILVVLLTVHPFVY